MRGYISATTYCRLLVVAWFWAAFEAHLRFLLLPCNSLRTDISLALVAVEILCEDLMSSCDPWGLCIGTSWVSVPAMAAGSRSPPSKPSQSANRIGRVVDRVRGSR